MPEPTTSESGLSSWAQALVMNKLTDKQRQVLEDMVQEGQADSLEEAACLLDWQTEAIEQTPGMWGP